RAGASVSHVLADAENEGSTCPPIAALVARTAHLLEAPPPAAPLLDAMVDAGQLVLEVDAQGAVWAYRPQTAELEAELAVQVRRLARAKPGSGHRRGRRTASSCRRPSSGPPCAPRSPRACR
ncbi:MAG: hypothetical protein ACR2L8_17850, partial [Solirubrobacteraceae bacterium]